MRHFKKYASQVGLEVHVAKTKYSNHEQDKKFKFTLLKIICKCNKPPDHPSSYRPLCMLDGVGKLFKSIKCERLEEFTEGS